MIHLLHNEDEKHQLKIDHYTLEIAYDNNRWRVFEDGYPCPEFAGDTMRAVIQKVKQHLGVEMAQE